MSNEMQEHHSKVSPEIWSAAKTKLPLRLPRPEETGLNRRPNVATLHNAPRFRPVSSRPVRIRRQLEIEPLPFSDAELESMAQRALLQSGVRGFTKLHVEVRDGGATLYGRLPTEFERQLAVQLIRRINGLSRVDHEISVEELSLPAQSPEPKKSRNRIGWWAALSLAGIATAALIGVAAF